MRLLRYVQRFFGLSRRKAWKLIMSGKVKVNGSTVFQPMLVLEGDEKVEVEGYEPIRFPEEVYVAFYKPRGFVVSKKDKFNRTIYEILPKKFFQLNAVGRLDKDSEGLLLLTNDNKIIHRLAHPKYKIKRGYIVKTHPTPSRYIAKGFEKGVYHGGEFLRADVCRVIGKSLLFVVLSEGKHREIRRMAERFGLEVLMLKRVFYGNIKLDVPPGRWRFLKKDEVKGLKMLVKMYSDL